MPSFAMTANMRGAIESFESSLALYPDDARRQHFLGVCLVSYGGGGGSSEERAKRCFEKAFELDPSDRSIALELNFYYSKLGDLESCRRHAAQVVEKTPNLWCSKWQRPGACIRNITSKPWWERSEFDWCEGLEEWYPVIRKELIDNLMKGDGNAMPRHWGEVGSATAGHDAEIVGGSEEEEEEKGKGGGRKGSRRRGKAEPEWREYVLFGYGDGDPRVNEADARKYAPRTMTAIESLVPQAVDMARRGAGEVIFSILAPGTRLKPHCASTNARLTCHLGLMVPKDNEKARIRVGEEWRTWKEGQCLFFDDSYEHEVSQMGDTLRAVLLLRFWHPEIPSDRWSEVLGEGMVQFEELQERRRMPPLSGELKRAFEARVHGNNPQAQQMSVQGLLRDGSMEMR